jgi:hypothetical protein
LNDHISTTACPITTCDPMADRSLLPVSNEPLSAAISLVDQKLQPFKVNQSIAIIP